MSWLKKIVPYNSLHRQILTGKGLSSNINQSGIYCIAYCCQCSTGSIGVQRGPHKESCSWNRTFRCDLIQMDGLKPHYNKSHAIWAVMRCNSCPNRMQLPAPLSLGSHRSHVGNRMQFGHELHRIPAQIPPQMYRYLALASTKSISTSTCC